LLEQLGEELTYVAEAGVVNVRVNCPENVSVAGDRGKLAQVLGNSAAILIRSAVPGGVLDLTAGHDKAAVHINIALEGDQREQEGRSVQENLDEIRLDTARSYAWTLGGEFGVTKKGYAFQLPALE
jgi:hypothetical protein